MKTENICTQKNIHILGRSRPDGGALTLFWTASGIEAEIRASELWVEFVSDYEGGDPWISIELNGALISRQMVPKGTHKICAFRNMSADTVKHVRILRETQAMHNDTSSLLQITNLIHNGEFLPFPYRKYTLEFVGDSITAGEGIYGAQSETDWITAFLSASRNYAVLTADAVDAEFSIVAQGGWGAYISWDGNTEHAVPKVYEQLCGIANGERNVSLGAGEMYDFSKRSADAVIVNLGTNDATGLALPDGSYEHVGVERFKKSVVDFLKTLRKHNKDAEIVWAYGMLGTPFLGFINEAVDTYKKSSGDERVSVFVLPQTETETFGARSHPGRKVHKAAAEALSGYLKRLLRM